MLTPPLRASCRVALQVIRNNRSLAERIEVTFQAIEHGGDLEIKNLQVRTAVLASSKDVLRRPRRSIERRRVLSTLAL